MTLNISGANRFNFNADLYAYLSHTYNGNTVTVTLMNTPDGLTGTGMNITLSDTGINGNIQDAVSDTSLSGTYIPSGGSMAFQGYNGMNPNGNWTLFIADIYGEYRATSQTLTSWSLTLDVVPEPVNVALGVFGMLFAVIVVVSRRAKRRI